MLPIIFRCYRLSSFIVLSLVLAGVMPLVGHAQAPANSPEEAPTEDLTDPNNLRPLTQADSVLSSQGGERLMSEAQAAISAEKYDVAVDKLQQARKIFNQLSNFHLQLANSFSGIEPKIQESQRRDALQNGQMRDEATYQLALVHRAQNQPELAVPLLIQVIRSQNPTSEMGKKSYQQLYELGFVDAPFSTSPAASSPAPASSPPAPAPSSPAPSQSPEVK